MGVETDAEVAMGVGVETEVEVATGLEEIPIIPSGKRFRSSEWTIYIHNGLHIQARFIL